MRNRTIRMVKYQNDKPVQVHWVVVARPHFTNTLTLIMKKLKGDSAWIITHFDSDLPAQPPHVVLRDLKIAA